MEPIQPGETQEGQHILGLCIVQMQAEQQFLQSAIHHAVVMRVKILCGLGLKGNTFL